jgi:predicted nucleotidyltransferase
MRVLGSDTPMVIVGATVPLVLLDFRQGGSGGRVTRDVDTVVHVRTWEEFAALKRRLIEAGFREGQGPQRLYFGIAELDVIPYSPTLAPQERLEWPGEDRAMSTLGLAEALASAHPEAIGDELVLPMVPLAGCVLLKFIAYRDRPAERGRDLVDVVYCFERYAEEPGGSRHNVAGVTVDDQEVSYEEAGAHLLGTEVAALARPATLTAIREILARLADEDGQPLRQILAEEARWDEEGERRHFLHRLFRVFAAGLSP